MNQPLPLNVPRQATDAAPAAGSRGRLHMRGALVLALAALLGGLFLVGYVPKQRQRERLASESAALSSELPRVALLRPTPIQEPPSLTLPASVQGQQEAALYARADGYVAAVHADIGDDVRAGQTLAELDNPEVDREIEQARANLASAEALQVRASAAREHSALNFDRYRSMTPGLISQQDVDEKRTSATLAAADVAVASAAVAAARANLGRLRQLKAFAKVVAPFSGTITARSIEVGALVARGKDAPLFKLSALDQLRVFAQVPQNKVAGVHPGQRARVAVAEEPRRVFEGVVARSAGALDSDSRTMTVEVRVDNPERRLLPGMFASVTLELRASGTRLSVPATAVIIDEHGTHVARVGAGGRVQLIPVVIERDNGAEVEIGSGLDGSESLIANPGPSIGAGSRVQVAQR